MNEDELDHDGPTIYDLQLEVAASRELAKKAETEAKALKQHGGARAVAQRLLPT